MATRVQTIQPSADCDYCHQKPKFPSYDFCSKTCAAQAALNMCNHCHKKLKFQNFDYCGKNCAALANPQPSRKPATNIGQTPAATASKGTSYPKGKNFNVQAQSQPVIDPMQIAKLVVQQIPQVQALLNGVLPAGAPVANTVPVAPAAQTVPVTQPRNNPFLGGLNNVQAPAANGTLVTSNPVPATAQQLHVSTQPAADPTTCLIPDCEQPVHVDAKGMRTSDYCSMKHREDAVTSGLASPCIMCLTLPQSETDYFCGKACREDANNKQE